MCVRVLKDRETGNLKGYGFVTFFNRQHADKAIDTLNGSEIKGKKLRVTPSQSKYRLFVGNIPKSWSRDDLHATLEAEGKGITNLELLMDPKLPGRNRGYAFVEYHNHACAEVARRHMTAPSFRLAGNVPTISWAEPRSEPDPSAMAQVKVIYVKGISEKVTEDDLKEAFQRFGEVTRVILPPPRPGQPKRDFGFVHFGERADALKAIETQEKVLVDGEWCWWVMSGAGG
ncbi:unnamed protein product [Closterium sp. NIES-53]